MQSDNIQSLMDRARGDEQCAVILLEHGGPEWATGFHCQQSVEKMLKAVLIHRGVNPPRRHDIVLLKQLLRAAGQALPFEFADLDLLDPFAVMERYADTGIAGQLSMQDAAAMVERVRTWADAVLES